MTHGTATHQLEPSRDPVAAMIADLSREYLEAGADRRHQIGETVAALITGTLVPMKKETTDER